eukprot:5340005-Pyramimonas_sp.AAC.1
MRTFVFSRIDRPADPQPQTRGPADPQPQTRSLRPADLAARTVKPAGPTHKILQTQAVGPAAPHFRAASGDAIGTSVDAIGVSVDATSFRGQRRRRVAVTTIGLEQQLCLCNTHLLLVYSLLHWRLCTRGCVSGSR